MISNPELSEAYENLIREAIILNSNIETEEDDTILFNNVDNVETFKKKGLFTLNKGLVVKLEDGSEVHITIQAYKKGDD